MEPTPYLNLLVYLAGPAIVGLVTAVVFLWRDLTNLKIHVAENYVKQKALGDLQKDTEEMKSIMYQIAAKVGVPIHRPL